MLQRTSPCSESCRVQQDEERISRTPSREEGVWEGVGQVEVRSGPEHVNHTQGFAVESPCSNLRMRNSILWAGEMFVKDGVKMCCCFVLT